MVTLLLLTDNLLSPRIDLRESPVDNSVFLLLTDGSYLQGPHGRYQAGYAIVSPVSIFENGPLPYISSAQQAELIALIRACWLAKGKFANIYTASMLLEWHMILVHFGNKRTFFFLGGPRCLWDLSSPTRDRTCIPCIGSTES